MAGKIDHLAGVSPAAKRTLLNRLFGLIDWLGADGLSAVEMGPILRSQNIKREDGFDSSMELAEVRDQLGATIQKVPLAHGLAAAYPSDHKLFDAHNLICAWTILAVLRDRYVDKKASKPHESALRSLRLIDEAEDGADALSLFTGHARDVESVLKTLDQIRDRKIFTNQTMRYLRHIRAVIARLQRGGTPPHPEREHLPLLKYASEIIRPPHLIVADDDDASVQIIRTIAHVDEDGEVGVGNPDAENHSDLVIAVPATDPARKFDQDFRRRFATGVSKAMQIRQSRAKSIWSWLTTAERAHLVATCLEKFKNQHSPDILFHLEFFLSLLFGRSIEELREIERNDSPSIYSKQTTWWSYVDGRFHLCFKPGLPEHRPRDKFEGLLADLSIEPLRLRVPEELNNLVADYINSMDRRLSDHQRSRQLWSAMWKDWPRTPSLGRVKDELFHSVMARKHDAAATGHIVGHTPRENPAVYYSSIRADELAREHADIGLNLVGADDTYRPAKGYVGSEIVAHREFLEDLFLVLRKDLKRRRKAAQLDIQAFHNSYVAVTFLVLSLATAHRPVRAPFQNMRDFDLVGQWLFIDDKQVRHIGASRIVPLTDLAIEQFEAYRRHLSVLATKLADPGGPIGQGIAEALSGEDFLLFFWEDAGPAIVTPGKLKQHLAEIYPMPLNWARHFWRTALRGRVSDEAMNALMGHTELAGAPFCEGSGLSLHDLEPLRTAMNQELRALRAFALTGLIA